MVTWKLVTQRNNKESLMKKQDNILFNGNCWQMKILRLFCQCITKKRWDIFLSDVIRKFWVPQVRCFLIGKIFFLNLFRCRLEPSSFVFLATDIIQLDVETTRNLETSSSLNPAHHCMGSKSYNKPSYKLFQTELVLK